MDRDFVSRLAHANHPVAAPLADDSVEQLLTHAIRRGDQRVVDLGCGGAEWLLRALVRYPKLTATGVDNSATALSHAQEAADKLGVSQRLLLREEDANRFSTPQPFDVLLSVGAAHAFGGLLPTLAAARRHLVADGRVLVGDGFWVRKPTPAAVEMLGEFADLATTVDRVVADGWTPVYGHVSTRHELDDYEWEWTGSLASWALANPEHRDSREALAIAGTHRDEWLRVYRDSFGFVCLVLQRSAAPATS